MAFLLLVFVIGILFTVSCADPGPLECFNDFDTTMVCEFTPNKTLDCTGYALEFVHIPDLNISYKCAFMSNKRDPKDAFKCECTAQLPKIVFEEKYKVNMLKGGEIIRSHNITSSDSIKPKAPEIILVSQTENGNYEVTWKTNYSKYDFFYPYLKFQLSYRKKGEQVGRLVNVSGNRFLEILGSSLEQKTVYAVKARSYSDMFETMFSDWSPEVEWKTASTDGTLTIFISILFILPIAICALSWCVARVKVKWWNNIPRASIEKWTPVDCKVLRPLQLHIENVKIDIVEEKPWKSSPIVGVKHNNDQLAIKIDPDYRESLQSDYARTYSITKEQSISDTPLQNHVEKALNALFSELNPSDCHFTNLPVGNTPVIHSQYKNVDGSVSTKDSLGSFHPLCLNSSGGSGASYSWVSLPPVQSSSFQDAGETTGLSFPSLMPMDVEYQPCNGFTKGAPPADSAPPIKESVQGVMAPSMSIRVDNLYQSFSDAVSKTSVDGPGFLEWLSKIPPDMELNPERSLICSVNPAYASLRSQVYSLDPFEEGYQPLQSLVPNHKDQ